MRSAASAEPSMRWQNSRSCACSAASCWSVFSWPAMRSWSESEQRKQRGAVERDDPADTLGGDGKNVQRVWTEHTVAAEGVHREGGLSIGGGGHQFGWTDYPH